MDGHRESATVSHIKFGCLICNISDYICQTGAGTVAFYLDALLHESFKYYKNDILNTYRGLTPCGAALRSWGPGQELRS